MADTPEAEPYRLDRRVYEYVQDIAFSPDGRTFATSGGLSSVFWDVATRSQIGEPLRGHAAFVTGISISPDGRLLAAPDEDGEIFIWDIARRERIGILENSAGRCRTSTSARMARRSWPGANSGCRLGSCSGTWRTHSESVSSWRSTSAGRERVLRPRRIAHHDRSG